MLPEEYSVEMAKAAAEGFGRETASKIAEAIGGFFPFLGLKRDAVETYVSEIKKSNLPPQMKMYYIANAKRDFKHLKNQSAVAQIAQEVAKEGTDFSPESSVDNEWLERFMDSAKFVSDEDLQIIWGNILAKEFEEPNSTPPSVIRILSEITPTYAHAFQILCSLAVILEATSISDDENNQPLEPFLKIILPEPDNLEYLEPYGIDFSKLNELETLGLIQFSPLDGYILQFDSNRHPIVHLTYGKNSVTITKYPHKEFPTGCILLTEAGHAIAKFAQYKIIPEHFERVVEWLKLKGIEMEESNMQLE